MNVLSLFTGIGGLDLGLERAGMTVVGQVEIDPWCRKVLAKHWPEVPRHDDVRTAAGWWGGRPAPDLVAGGFPCQPVSLAGKGLAQADSRWLWPAFAGIVRALRPRYVLVENVPGLLGRGMGDVLGDLAAIGYDAEWDCVPATFVGAPHIRNRVWIVAYPQRNQLRDQPGRRDGQSRPRTAVAGNDGTPQPVANADRGRLEEQSERDGEQVAGIGSPLGRDPIGFRHAVADAERPRLERRTRPAVPGERRSSVFVAASSQGLRGEWPAEPGVGRVANGIPDRVDRLRGLGNAVVPQVAEHIGRLIMNQEAA